MSSTPLVEKLAPDSTVARLQAGVFAHRNLLAGAPLIAALLLAPASGGALREFSAFALAALGVALRAWCTLYNRFAQGDRKTLATGGPYAWMRNPLYVGNTLVLLGAATIAGPLWLVPLTSAWAFLVYEQVVRHEERRLSQKYGSAYAAYCRSVPRWIPRVRAALGPLPRAFGPALLVQSRSLLLLLPFVAKLWALHS
jgi:protein-S-isoprenylcysteine O-methyltransferase Ste14